MSTQLAHQSRLPQYRPHMRTFSDHIELDLCSFQFFFRDIPQLTHCVVPPIRMWGQTPVNDSKFFKHWVVAVIFVKYDGNAKNSNLLFVRCAIQSSSMTYDTPKGAGSRHAAVVGAELGMEYVTVALSANTGSKSQTTCFEERNMLIRKQ